ncbi:MAG: hypothetical protein AABY32_01040 [Nanoarchaeota archaeon]
MKAENRVILDWIANGREVIKSGGCNYIFHNNSDTDGWDILEFILKNRGRKAAIYELENAYCFMNHRDLGEDSWEFHDSYFIKKNQPNRMNFRKKDSFWLVRFEEVKVEDGVNNSLSELFT